MSLQLRTDIKDTVNNENENTGDPIEGYVFIL